MKQSFLTNFSNPLYLREVCHQLSLPGHPLLRGEHQEVRRLHRPEGVVPQGVEELGRLVPGVEVHGVFFFNSPLKVGLELST